MATDEDKPISNKNEIPTNNIELKPTEDEAPNPKYPKHVFLIVANEFCERFCYYGMRTILAIYLDSSLNYSEEEATVVYHTFVMLCYFFPLIGGMIADSYLGKFRTIFYLSILYALGSIILAIASNTTFSIDHRLYSLLGLLFIAIGTGGIKPCVSSFGGDQFVVPQQERQLVMFFSVFYFSINAGSLLSSFITPELRVVRCLGQYSCFPLAFGVPAALMVISIVLFLFGKPQYTIKNPEGNISWNVTKCIGRGIRKTITNTEKKDHWLDRSEDVYGSQLVEDTKIFLEIAYLFSPTILFWALYEQQGSIWTFQAVNMNGKIWGFTIKPDQMQVINPILILVLIPVFQLAIYPLLEKLKLIRTSMEKLFWGGIIAAVAFGISSAVEFAVQADHAVLPKAGEGQLRIYNSLPCPVQIDVEYQSKQWSWTVSNLAMLEERSLPVTGEGSLKFSAHLKGPDCPIIASGEGVLTLFENEGVSYIISEQTSVSNTTLSIERVSASFDDVTKSDQSQAKVQIIYRISSENTYTLNTTEGFTQTGTLQPNTYASNVLILDSSEEYSFTVDYQSVLSTVSLGIGGVYTIFYAQGKASVITLTPPNRIHILWQIPQLVIITIAEIMFSITGLEFSYSQAPESMKSLVSSLWLITDAFGNVLIILTATFVTNVSQAVILGVYAILMALVMILFILLARRYSKVIKILKHQ